MEKNGLNWSFMETKIRFIGFKFVNIEENGRISIPSTYRSITNAKIFFIVPGSNKTLHIYPEESFLKLEEKISKLESEEDRKIITDYIYSNAVSIKRDSMWRISIPQHLIDYASLKETVKIVGGNDKLDIWDPKNHENYNKSLLTEGSITFKKIGI